MQIEDGKLKDLLALLKNKPAIIAMEGDLKDLLENYEKSLVSEIEGNFAKVFVQGVDSVIETFAPTVAPVVEAVVNPIVEQVAPQVEQAATGLLEKVEEEAKEILHIS